MSFDFPADATLVIARPAGASAPVTGTSARFPVRRIFCVGRNYADHAKEMGFTGREPPFFFMKFAEAMLPVAGGETGQMAYPTLTSDLHHEVELVVAIGRSGADIAAADASAHIYGYAVGLDMTRRDLQNGMKTQGRPWEIGKAFEQSAPVGPIVPAAQAGDIGVAPIELTVNGQMRQHGTVDQMIWSVPEIIEHLSAAWELYAGDLIYTGTPAGVAAVVRGDVLNARIAGLPDLAVEIV
jgi:fumarylpyruvate hydrolase